jgi:hypothetical protein
MGILSAVIATVADVSFVVIVVDVMVLMSS